MVFSFKFILLLSFRGVLNSVTETLPCSLTLSSQLSQSSWDMLMEEMSSLGSAAAHLNVYLHQSSPCPQTPASQEYRVMPMPLLFPRFAPTYDSWQTSKRWRNPLKNNRSVSGCDDLGAPRGAERLVLIAHLEACLGPHYPLKSFCLCFLSLSLGRLQCDAVQAEPYALRAVLQPCPAPDGPHHGPAANSFCAVV